jgi:uncharacterized protein YecE (DUF72 family)
MWSTSGVAEARIGISGWTYAGWRGDFYPRGLAHRRELEYASRRLTSIEVNGTFYSLQKPSSFAAWAEQTPSDFVFSIKAGRFITHMKRLRGTELAVANYFASGPLALGAKLGPVLWQLPPTLAYDEALLRDFFTGVPRTTAQAAAVAAGHDERVTQPFTEVRVDVPLRHAVEVRHPSMATDEALALFRELDVAVVVADSAHRFPCVEEVTGSFVYVRLHGDDELYVSGYTAQALDRWATLVRGWLADDLDVYVYFDNDVKGYAPHDAMALMERVQPAVAATR